MAEVAGVLGVVSTISGINSRNQQIERQNEATRLQIEANNRAEELRLQNISFQRGVQEQQASVEQAQRGHSAAVGILEVNVQAQQAHFENELNNNKALVQNAIDSSNVDRQFAAAKLGVSKVEYDAMRTFFNVQQETNQNTLQSTEQSTQTGQGLTAQALQVEQLLKQGDTRRAAQAAANYTLGSATTENSARSSFGGDMLTEVQRRLQSNNITENDLLQMSQTGELNQILLDLGVIQRDATMGAAELQSQYANNDMLTNRSLLQLQQQSLSNDPNRRRITDSTNRRISAIQGGEALNQGQDAIGRLQRDIAASQQTFGTQLDTNRSNLGLGSQLVSAPPLWSDALSVGVSAYPVISNFFSAPPPPTPQPINYNDFPSANYSGGIG